MFILLLMILLVLLLLLLRESISIVKNFLNGISIVVANWEPRASATAASKLRWGIPREEKKILLRKRDTE